MQGSNFSGGSPYIITLVPHTAGTTKFSTITRVELGEAYF